VTCRGLRPALSRAVPGGGLKGRLPLIGGAVITDESILPTFATRRWHHHPADVQRALDTPVTGVRWRSTAGASTRCRPTPETCYTSGRWINEAARAVNGNVEERRPFLAAFRKTEIPDASSRARQARTLRQPHQNIYVRKVERKGGESRTPVIHTFPAVSQFLDLQAGRLPQAAAVHARLAALSGVLGRRPGQSGTRSDSPTAGRR